MKKLIIASATIAALALSASAFADSNCYITFGVNSKSDVVPQIVSKLYPLDIKAATNHYNLKNGVQFTAKNEMGPTTITFKTINFGTSATESIACGNYTITASLTSSTGATNNQHYTDTFKYPDLIQVKQGSYVPNFYDSINWKPIS